MSSRMDHLTPEDVDRIATAAADKAIRAMFVAMGVNIEDHEALLKMQKDFAHMRRWRESVDALTLKGMAVAVSVVMTSILAAIWMAMTHGRP